MRKALCAVIVLAAFAAFAEETPVVPDSPLVALAKRSATNRKKAKVVITDANLTRSAARSATTEPAQSANAKPQTYTMPQFPDSLLAPQTAAAAPAATPASTANYSRYPASTNQMTEVTSSVRTVEPPTSTTFNNPPTTVTPYSPASSVTLSQPSTATPTAPPASNWQ